MRTTIIGSAISLALVACAACTTKAQGVERPLPKAEPGVDAKKFEPFRRSLRAVKQLTAQPHFTHGDFTALVDAATTEGRLLANRVEGPRELEVMEMYEPVVQAYMDADFLWNLRNATTDAWHKDIALFSERFPPSDAKQRVAMAKGYGLKVQEELVLSEPTEYLVVVPADSAKRVSDIATAKLDDAESKFAALARGRVH